MLYFIIGILLLWRSLLFLISFLGGILLAFKPTFPYSEIYLTSSGLPNWVWSFANFDGVHYLSISRYGYAGLIGFEQVFFPLFPLLINILHKILPLVNPIIIGLVISNIFFLLTCIFFCKLLKLDYKNGVIKWVIIFLCFFPTSFFYGSLYTESLFLFLVITSFYAARRKSWWWAGVLGGLASATRFVGIFLLPALLWEWHEKKIKNQKSKIKNNTKLILRFTLYALRSPILYLIPLGLVSYMLYLQLRFGDALYFWHVQPVFGAERSGANIITPLQVLWRYFRIITTLPLTEYKLWTAIFELGSFVFAIIMMILAHKQKIRQPYLIFSWLALILPTLTGTLSSMPRYILVIFPIYIVLANFRNTLAKVIMTILFIILLTVSTVLFTRGYWLS